MGNYHQGLHLHRQAFGVVQDGERLSVRGEGVVVRACVLVLGDVGDRAALPAGGHVPDLEVEDLDGLILFGSDVGEENRPSGENRGAWS
jgi:hypothetical protein